MQLYHHPFSPSARRVLTAADHLGVARMPELPAWQHTTPAW
jgi:hypothetical protein